MSRFKLLPPTALIAGALLAGAWLVGRALSTEARREQEGARLLGSVMERVRQHYVGDVADEELWHRAVTGLMAELGDPYSAYLPPERLERLAQSTSNSYRGVGLSVDVRDGWITVSQPRPGSPADRAGIRAGDRLVEIEGRSMRGWTVGEARQVLRGPLGSTVEVVIERGTGTRMPVVLARADIRVSAVARVTLLDRGVGYVAVTTFSDSTEAELTAAIASLLRGGARSLILDLRGNPGGLLDQGVGVAGLFLGSGKHIVTTRGRVADANHSYVDETPERWATMPIAVLVDRGTASAAEIVAGALQDHDRALVIGRVTYGKGSAQALYPLENGAALMLTHARWFTPLGRSLEGALPGERPLADADSARPVFRTASGRAVYGGGGIVPDILAGDSIADPNERRFFAELGADVPQWRVALADEARALLRDGLVRDSLFEVRAEWRTRVQQRVRTVGLHVSAGTFEAASAYVERALGLEVARQGFGAAYAQRRQVRNDVVVERAAEVLRRARLPQDVFLGE